MTPFASYLGGAAYSSTLTYVESTSLLPLYLLISSYYEDVVNKSGRDFVLLYVGPSLLSTESIFTVLVV